MRSARSCALARAGRAGRNGIMIAAGRKAVSREAEEQKPDRQKWEGRVETARGDMDGKRLDGGNSADRIRQNLTAKRGRSILSLYTSFITVDPGKIKLIYTLQGKKYQALTKVVLPSSVPAIISNMKVNIGLCLVGVIIGEFLAARDGLGYLIIYSSQVFKMDWLLMSIVLLCIMATLLYSLINLLEKWCLRRF